MLPVCLGGGREERRDLGSSGRQGKFGGPVCTECWLGASVPEL